MINEPTIQELSKLTQHTTPGVRAEDGVRALAKAILELQEQVAGLQEVAHNHGRRY